MAGNLLPHLLAETPVSHSEHVIVPCRCWHTYSVKGRVVNIFSIRGHPVSVTTTFSCCCPLKAAQMTHRHTSFCGTSLCCAPRLIGCVFFFSPHKLKVCSNSALIKQVCRRHLSNSICSLHVSVSHFGNSHNISNDFIVIMLVMVVCDQ